MGVKVTVMPKFTSSRCNFSNAAQTVEQNGAVLKYPLLVITRTSKCDPKAMQP